MVLKKDLVIRDENEGVVKVYPYGGVEQKRYESVLEILFEADRKCLEKLLNEKQHKEEIIDSQIDEKYKQKFQKIAERGNKRYNLTQTARILKVHRQTIYYWIKKKWVRPKRDYKNYPVFTVLDIERLIEWKGKLRVDDFQKTRKRT